MALLEIHELKKSFLAPDATQHLVIDIPSFKLEEKSQIALSGESGSGKTTFLNLIAGILKPDQGRIMIPGSKCPPCASQSEIDCARPPSATFSRHSTCSRLHLFGECAPGHVVGAGVDRERAIALLKRVGLSDRLKHYPRQLSSGQQQRVAVARAGQSAKAGPGRRANRQSRSEERSRGVSAHSRRLP
jgi:putative ABC transport system ATP-binding protein